MGTVSAVNVLRSIVNDRLEANIGLTRPVVDTGNTAGRNIWMGCVCSAASQAGFSKSGNCVMAFSRAVGTWMVSRNALRTAVQRSRS